MTEKSKMSILEITKKRGVSVINNRLRNLTKVMDDRSLSHLTKSGTERVREYIAGNGRKKT